MNKNDLINYISKYTLTKKESKKFVDLIFEKIKDSLIVGEKISIQNFGTFIVKFHKSKKMYDPKKNKYLPIEPRKKIKFLPSKKLLEILNYKKLEKN